MLVHQWEARILKIVIYISSIFSIQIVKYYGS